MTQLIKVRIGETEVWIEPDENAIAPARPKDTETVHKLLEEGISFDLFSKPIAYICKSFSRTMTALPDNQRPNKFAAEFGFKISGEGNIIMVKGGAEASLKITAEWQMK